MIGVSQLQFPDKDSSKLKFISYMSSFVSLLILVNPADLIFCAGIFIFRTEIKALHVYKEVKIAKQEKINKKEYWKIFFKNNVAKLIIFSLCSSMLLYFTFSSTFLLAALLGTIPLSMLLILLQSELRPKDFNPITLFKAAIKFLLEGIKENSRGLINNFDVKLEHLLPHQLNDDIMSNIDKLNQKYGEKIPDDVLKSDEYMQFIEDINNYDKLNQSDKGRLITFLNDFCNGDDRHNSGFTGGQILLLVLRACSDGQYEEINDKKNALIVNLLDTQIFSRKERVPNTCFTGIVYRMLSSLEIIHSDPEIKFTPPKAVLLSEAKNAARDIIVKKLERKKNNREIINAWFGVQSNSENNDSQKIVDDFIADITIPLMRKLLNFSSQYSEQVVLTLIKDLHSIDLCKLDNPMRDYISRKIRTHDVNDQEGLLTKRVETKVFLKLLNEKLLKTDFSQKFGSNGISEKIADEIIQQEIKEFQSKLKKTTEDQVVRMLENLRFLSKDKKAYRIYMELNRDDKNDKEKIKKILQKKLELTDVSLNEMLKKEDSIKLKLGIEEIYKKNKEDISNLYEEIKEVKKEFIENELLTAQEIEGIIKEQIIVLNEVKMKPSGNLSRSFSVDNLSSFKVL
ncbi:hypothetical protein [Wolbachia endosymbiont of Chironomus riparius]|uniref:hypothetical protein n=1 Tax=Wolbachia endosymbiont of Chironomus riparius TaxID=2883238 RepID=UPI0020A08BB9|nr:hypothetical protein [Wolbachia endosymbiont of Chironomus riparius]